MALAFYMPQQMRSRYVGRFAPSPSGPLHLGSLVAALGSYLQARANNGQWLVRIEDIDPPREQPGAASLILKQLEHYGLHWDGEVRYQSQQSEHYLAQLEQWQQQGLAYYCQCTRKQIKAAGGYYPGTCRNLMLGADNAALRLKTDAAVYQFDDRLNGTISVPKALAEEDFIVKRRDGLFAYNLAVVLDDIDQGVTEVVRGADLIEPTGRQIYIYHCLGQTLPSYLHLPLILDEHGNKLSKQNHAPSISDAQPQQLLLQSLKYLGQHSDPQWLELSCEQLLQLAVEQWDWQRIPRSEMHSL